MSRDVSPPLLAATARWTMELVLDGEQAFARLEAARGEFDAVLFDERLGWHNATALLSRVRGSYPGMACIVLRSGSDRVMSTSPLLFSLVLNDGLRSLDFSEALERVYNLDHCLSRPQVRDICGDIGALPQPPQTFWRLGAALNDPNSSMASIAAIVESDPILSAKILQVVNSAFFGRARRTASVTQALSFLGFDMLRGLLLSSHMFATMENMGISTFSIDHFQRYAISVARSARRFVKKGELADEAFTAALLHDIGQVVLALRCPEGLQTVLDRMGAGEHDQEGIEREVIGVTHAEAGAYLLAGWGLPTTLVEAVAFHREPSLTPLPPSKLLAVAHAADALTGIVACGDPEQVLDTTFIQAAGFESELAGWRAIVEEDAAVTMGHQAAMGA